MFIQSVLPGFAQLLMQTHKHIYTALNTISFKKSLSFLRGLEETEAEQCFADVVLLARISFGGTSAATLRAYTEFIGKAL